MRNHQVLDIRVSLGNANDWVYTHCLIETGTSPSLLRSSAFLLVFSIPFGRQYSWLDIIYGDSNTNANDALSRIRTNTDREINTFLPTTNIFSFIHLHGSVVFFVPCFFFGYSVWANKFSYYIIGTTQK